MKNEQLPNYENLDRMLYTLVTDENDHLVKYDQMVDRLSKKRTKRILMDEKCDTPVKYQFGHSGRYGFISVKDFLVKGQLAHYAMIVNTQSEESYVVHPDLAKKAVAVEKEVLSEQQENVDVFEIKDILLPQIQVEINIKEYYVW